MHIQVVMKNGDSVVSKVSDMTFAEYQKYFLDVKSLRTMLLADEAMFDSNDISYIKVYR